MNAKKSAEYYEMVARVIEYIDSVFPEQPDVIELASVAGLSEYHFTRIFSEWAGLPPKRYLQFLRREYAKEILQKSSNSLDAALSLGMNGTGRLHDLFVTTEAVTPGQWKTNGKDLKIRYGFHPSPFGKMFAAKTDKGICELHFVDDLTISEIDQTFRKKWENAELIEDATATQELDELFEPSRNRIKIHLFGTNFQVKVWEALMSIPEGSLISYEDLAERTGSKQSVRAVASAVAKNPLAYLIPCHRVIRKTGVLNRYRWGATRKAAIIAYEAAKLEKL
ncbi:methylated-DNA--[protein]-cysteine S-methyltransferase [Leptospira broomii serovar Hurstbridge str. 5399]|uniref:methylated-DNA--[protein]-cysteine S-methyltransferase n=1 Tax=Leptospira broomii serovar Hurstbridge str. 5399 TaxID=1049789 RepID=T0GH13_9LEPT|nr:methylated-DNA--[protein]-cysteine S-methyltransferase [Leptospira broomii]EQA46124.1 methylated-DNA--[protein]-cysteine S-methyltransferase [Leptospira broomii serovar Hurstbridge str. 5399]